MPVRKLVMMSHVKDSKQCVDLDNNYITIYITVNTCGGHCHHKGRNDEFCIPYTIIRMTVLAHWSN